MFKRKIVRDTAPSQLSRPQQQQQQPEIIPLTRPDIPPHPFAPDPLAAIAWGKHVFASLTWLRIHDDTTHMLVDPLAADAVGVAVIVEPRLSEMEMLEAVVRCVVHHLAPRRWGLCIVHGTENATAVTALVRDWPNVRLRDLGIANLPPATRTCTTGYNRLACDPQFWRDMPHEQLLIFQTDAWMFTGAGMEAGAPLLAYDFVGAPWLNTCFVCGALIRATSRCCGRKSDDALVHALAPDLVGNGGFSLRHRSAMVRVCRTFRLSADPHCGPDDPREVISDSSAEDTFAVAGLIRLGGRVAPRALASTFSIEQTLPLVIPASGPWSIGAHKPYVYHSAAIIEAMVDACTLPLL